MSKLPSGIYKITNLKNGKVYIGQSENIFIRRKQHFSALDYGHHDNKQMQSDYSKQRGRGFHWEVVEYCSIDKLNEREKYWIDFYHAVESGYNKGWVPYKRKKTTQKRKTGYGRYGRS